MLCDVRGWHLPKRTSALVGPRRMRPDAHGPLRLSAESGESSSRLLDPSSSQHEHRKGRECSAIPARERRAQNRERSPLPINARVICHPDCLLSIWLGTSANFRNSSQLPNLRSSNLVLASRRVSQCGSQTCAPSHFFANGCTSTVMCRVPVDPRIHSWLVL